MKILPLLLLALAFPAQAASVFDDVIIENSCSLPAQSAGRALILDGSNEVVSSSVTSTELGYLSGVTSALQTQLAAKAPLASPALTGFPTAPTQTQGDSSTRIATTAYTDTAVSNATIPDATTLVKGKIKLAGDLAGTADLPTVPGLASKYDASNPSGYITSSGAPVQSVAGKTGIVTLIKGDVGLGNLDNTSDANKPISTATQTALDGKQATGSYLTALTSDVSASGPGSAVAVVNSVGGSSASAINTAAVLANAATSANTANTIVKRGASGEFTAGAITANGLTVDTIGGVLKASSGVVSGSATTSDLPEGSNLYYSDTRVQTAAKNGTSSQILYVSKDAGNDTYDGSLLHPYKTIGAAITAANAVASYYKQVNIHVSPINNGGSAGGNYNENLTLSQQGVNLICDNAGAYTRPCTVGGTLTANLTGTSGGSNFIAASNEATVAGFVFTSGASDTVTFSGSTYQRLIAMNCYFQASAARSAVNTNTGVSGSTPSEFRSYDTTFENNSSTIETVRLTSGRFWLYGTTPTVQNNNTSGPSFIQDGASSMIANIAQFTGQYRLSDNTATATFNLSTIASGTAACLTTPASPNTGYALFAYAGCNSSASPSMTGTGVVVFATGNACIGTGCSTASTITTSSLGKLPEGGVFLQGSTGALTALSTNEIVGYGKTVRAMKIENMVGAAATFTCTVNPAVTLYDCGTSAGACTSGRTALANVTLTAANSGANGTVTSSTLAAGHYWALEISAGTCTILDANVSAEAAMQ